MAKRADANPLVQPVPSLLRREIIRASESHSAVDLASLINIFLDTMPRVEVRWTGRPRPAFRTCGTVGFGIAAVIAFLAALAGHRPLAPLAIAIGVSVLSFFGWTRIRRAITGVETLVLIEHVWLALLLVSAFLYWWGMPVAATLDPFCAGLSFFLAGGRVGCCLVGCCHGHPSSVGFCYPPGHADAGFAPHLVGVRLFPVQFLEFTGLVAIGITTAVAIPFVSPGRPTLWFLLSYSFLRFSLEELRADDRPFFWEMSVPRWMCIAEVLFAIVWMRPSGWVLIAIVVVVFGLYLGRNTSLRALRSSNLEELRSRLREYPAEENRTSPSAWSTSQGVTIAISPAPHGLHVSLCLPSRREDVQLLSRLAFSAFPSLDPESGLYSGFNTLHFVVREKKANVAAASAAVYGKLYGHLLRASRRADRTLVMVSLPKSQDITASNAPWFWN